MASSKATFGALLAFFTSMAVAQGSSTVLTLPFYGYDSVSIVGSVVSANKAATTLALSCAPIYQSIDSDCGLFPYQTLTIGPSTYNMYMSDEGFTGTQDCQTSATPAVCTESAGGSEANFPGSSTTSYEASDVATFPVTVTGGLEKLNGAGAGATTSSGSAKTTDTASAGAAVTILSGTATSTSTGTARSGSFESSSPTGSATGSATTSGASATASTGAATANGISGGMAGVIAAGVCGVAGVLAL